MSDFATLLAAMDFAADKHRNQAAQLGVNAFLGKPYQESELLQHILTFVGAPTPAVTQELRLH